MSASEVDPRKIEDWFSLVNHINATMCSFHGEDTGFEFLETLGRRDTTKRPGCDVLVMTERDLQTLDLDPLVKGLRKVTGSYALWSYYCVQHAETVRRNEKRPLDNQLRGPIPRFIKSKMEKRPPWGDWAISAVLSLSPTIVLCSKFDRDLPSLVKTACDKLDAVLIKADFRDMVPVWKQMVKPVLRQRLFRGIARRGDGVDAFEVILDTRGKGKPGKRAALPDFEESTREWKKRHCATDIAQCTGDNFAIDALATAPSAQDPDPDSAPDTKEAPAAPPAPAAEPKRSAIFKAKTLDPGRKARKITSFFG